MAQRSIKRIQNDIKLYHKSDLNDHGIYVHFNEKNIFNAKALIIGPDETPYKNGFYFFDINYTEKYPQEPPKVVLCTLNKRTRFNPNLYTGGKVCLSILGTWSGPKWSSVQTLKSVLLSIQSLMNENPIINEPGWENEVGIYSGKIFEYLGSGTPILVAPTDANVVEELINKTKSGISTSDESEILHFLKLQYHLIYLQQFIAHIG